MDNRFSVPITLIIKQPDSTFTANTGEVRAFATNTITFMSIDQAPLPNGGYSSVFGILFLATVTIPSPYTGTGQFYFTQLIQPDRKRTSTQTPPTSVSEIDTQAHSSYVLDGTVIYDSTFSTGTSSAPTPNSSPPFNGNGDYPTHPGTAEYPNVQVGAVNGSEAFVTYLMFVPPGTGSLPVAIQSLNWHWAGSMSLGGDASGLALSPNPVATPCTSQPEWTGNGKDFTFQ